MIKMDSLMVQAPINFLKNDQAVNLNGMGKRVYSDTSSPFWDVTRAVVTETGFEVLVETQIPLQS